MNQQNLVIQKILKSHMFWTGQVLIFCLAIFLFANLSSRYQNISDQQNQLRDETLITMASDYASPFLQTRNVISLNLLLKQLAERPEILSGKILDANGTVLTEAGNPRQNGIELDQPIDFNQQLIGHLRLTLKPATENNEGIFITLILALFIMTAWALFCLWYYSGQYQHWQSVNRQLKPLIKTRGTSPAELSDGLKQQATGKLRMLDQLTGLINGEQINSLTLLDTQSESRFNQVILVHCAPVASHSMDQDELKNRAHTQKVQTWLERVAQLYHGQLVENGQVIAFGLESEPEDAAIHAVHAARVLQFLSQDQFPVAISIAAGEIWTGQVKGPWPIIRCMGPALNDLYLVHLNNPGNRILVTESLFQHSSLNDRLSAEIFKDLVLSDGYRVEVWQIEALTDQTDALLRNQADKLPLMTDKREI